MVTGRLKQRSFETKEGEKRTVVELEVDEIGPSLRYATAKVNKVSRGSGGGDFGGGGGGGGGGGTAAASAPAGRTTRGAPRRPAVRRRRVRRRATLLDTSLTDDSRRRQHDMAKAPLRKPKKKVCAFCKDKVTYIDYKDTALLRKFISDRGKIRARRVTGNCSQHQRDVAVAVKNSREMALLPYTSTAR